MKTLAILNLDVLKLENFFDDISRLLQVSIIYGLIVNNLQSQWKYVQNNNINTNFKLNRKVIVNWTYGLLVILLLLFSFSLLWKEVVFYYTSAVNSRDDSFYLIIVLLREDSGISGRSRTYYYYYYYYYFSRRCCSLRFFSLGLTV